MKNMKNVTGVYIAFALIIIALVGCNKSDDQAMGDEIVYQAVNKEFVKWA